MNKIFSKTNSVKLGITGGKDSRLVLALAINSGIKSKIQLFTNGHPNHPDVVVGKMIADRLNLQHDNIIPSERPKIQFEDANALIERLALHSYLNEGMFGAWDLKATERLGSNILLTGLTGGILKNHLSGQYNFSAQAKPEDFIERTVY